MEPYLVHSIIVAFIGLIFGFMMHLFSSLKKRIINLEEETDEMDSYNTFTKRLGKMGKERPLMLSDRCFYRVKYSAAIEEIMKIIELLEKHLNLELKEESKIPEIHYVKRNQGEQK